MTSIQGSKTDCGIDKSSLEDEVEARSEKFSPAMIGCDLFPSDKGRYVGLILENTLGEGSGSGDIVEHKKIGISRSTNVSEI